MGSMAHRVIFTFDRFTELRVCTGYSLYSGDSGNEKGERNAAEQHRGQRPWHLPNSGLLRVANSGSIGLHEPGLLTPVTPS